MTINIEFVELKCGQISLICPACMKHTRSYYLVGKSIVCRKCADELHEHMEATHYPPSPESVPVLKGHEVCPKCGLVRGGGVDIHNTPPVGVKVCAVCQYPTKPRVNFDSGIEWGLSQIDSL